MIKAGIIDPAMVTRSALQNAASIAKNILTTEVIVADKPEKEPAGGGMPRRHGRHGRHDVRRASWLIGRLSERAGRCDGRSSGRRRRVGPRSAVRAAPRCERDASGSGRLLVFPRAGGTECYTVTDTKRREGSNRPSASGPLARRKEVADERTERKRHSRRCSTSPPTSIRPFCSPVTRSWPRTFSEGLQPAMLRKARELSEAARSGR